MVVVSGTLLFRKNLNKIINPAMLSSKTLSLRSMIPSSSSVITTMYAKLFNRNCFIRRSLRECLATVKRSLLSKRVPNSDGLIRVNITIETDEDDLIGGFRLVDGNTVWHNGPIVEALERGAILLLDEIDLASNKILCLQSILEGKEYSLKRSVNGLTLQVDSTSSPQQTLKVKVQTTDDSLELTCSTKHS